MDIRSTGRYTYLHVPVQAASDEILFRMKREYTQDDFRRVVESVRAANPTVTIATDIIAGFPGETEEDFEETMELCRQYEFPCEMSFLSVICWSSGGGGCRWTVTAT